MRVIYLLFYVFYTQFAMAEYPEWFLTKVQEDISRTKRVHSFLPHKDEWENEPYKTIELSELWGKSDKDESIFLNEENRKPYKVIFKGGRIFDSKGIEIDTRDLPESAAIFVLLPDGNIYLSKTNVEGYFEHHSLAAGMPVVCAGKMVIHNGVIEKISDFSAQYESKDYYPLTKVVSKLKKEGISFGELKVMYSVDFK